MKRLFIAAAALAVTATATSAMARQTHLRPMPEAALSQLSPRVDRFIETLRTGDEAGALSGLLEGSILLEQTPQIAQLVAQITLMVANAEGIESSALIDSHCPTERYCRVRYAVNGQRTGMGLWLYVYRTSAGDWTVMSILMGETPAFLFFDQ